MQKMGTGASLLCAARCFLGLIELELVDFVGDLPQDQVELSRDYSIPVDLEAEMDFAEVWQGCFDAGNFLVEGLGAVGDLTKGLIDLEWTL